MIQSKSPIWKSSMLNKLNLLDIYEWLYEIAENGDPYGYEVDHTGHYNDYKELFDDLSDSAYRFLEALRERDVKTNWDDMTVALLGETYTVLGYDAVEADYCHMLEPIYEDWAVKESVKRLMRLTKSDLIRTFRKVMTILVLFFDLKAAHDCLTSIVQELDERELSF